MQFDGVGSTCRLHNAELFDYFRYTSTDLQRPDARGPMSQTRPFRPFPLLLTAVALAWPASSAFAQAPAASKPATKPAATAPATPTSAPSSPVAQATLLGQFGDWGAY